MKPGESHMTHDPKMVYFLLEEMRWNENSHIAALKLILVLTCLSAKISFEFHWLIIFCLGML